MLVCLILQLWMVQFCFYAAHQGVDAYFDVITHPIN